MASTANFWDPSAWPASIQGSNAMGEMISHWFDSANMALEASAVVGLRVMKVARVNPFTHPVEASLAALEVNRMFSEKALTSLQVMARAGQANALSPMHAQVSANRRRLSR